MYLHVRIIDGYRVLIFFEGFYALLKKEEGNKTKIITMNNSYLQLIDSIKRVLLSPQTQPIEQDISEKTHKALRLASAVEHLATNKRVLSPYLPILKRFYQVLQLEEITTSAQRGHNFLPLANQIIAYAEGKIDAATMFVILRGERYTDCPICMDALKFSSANCPAEKPCAHWFHPACLNQWRQNNAACPCCRQRANSTNHQCEVNTSHIDAYQLGTAQSQHYRNDPVIPSIPTGIGF